MTVSEAASKKNGKRKRGRPRVFNEQTLAVASAMAPDVKTKRHAQNIIYRQLALYQLVEDPRCKWLCDGPAMHRGEAGCWKPGILAELGRIADQNERLSLALQICELEPKPTTKEAVVLLRRCRLGTEAKVDCLALTKELIRAAENFTLRYPRTTTQQILAALENAAYAFCPDDDERIER